MTIIDCNGDPKCGGGLQEQIARVDYVAHVVIEEIQSLDHVDNGPVESCGVKYRVRVVERFKGAPEQEVSSFATSRLLLPLRRLRKGDHVLVLLRNAPKSVATAAAVQAADTRTLQESVAMSAGTEACRRARGDFYLNDYAENIFAITFEQGAKAWLEFLERGRNLTVGTPAGVFMPFDHTLDLMPAIDRKMRAIMCGSSRLTGS